MTRQYRMQGRDTLEIIDSLVETGIEKLAVLIRHSERHFHEKGTMEPFMGLTDSGKDHAMDFGAALREDFKLTLFSSPFCRCIETAYLLDKGFFVKNGVCSSHPVLSAELSPFYVRDIEKTIEMVTRLRNDAFLRSWFAGEISADIILDPEETCSRIVGFMASQLETLKKNEMAVLVSHDWNIFPVREFKMGMTHEAWGPVGYLDSLILYKKAGRHYLTSRLKKEMPV